MTELSTNKTMQELATQINEQHRLVEGAARATINYALQAGQLLLEAKSRCRHGQWQPWLEVNFEDSVRTAQSYMRIADHWPEIEAKAQSSALLSLSSCGISRCDSSLVRSGRRGRWFKSSRPDFL